MGCFDNIVGIRGCGYVDTDVYIQQLPGISIADFDQSLSNEHKNGYTRIQELIEVACSEAVADIRTALAGKYTLKSFVQNDVTGYWLPNKEVVASQTGYLTGIRVNIARVPYLLFYLHSVKLFVDFDGDVDLQVWDLTQNKLLDTITVTCVAGDVSVNLCDKKYFTDKQAIDLFIGYESDFDCYRTQLSTRGVSENYTKSYIGFSNKKVAVGSSKIADNLQANSYSSGISLSYSLQCDFTEYLCNMRNLLAPAILYKAGAKMMADMKLSTRLTPIVRAFKADHKETQGEWENEYNVKMGHLLQNMQLPESECFACGKSVEIRTALP